MLSTIPAYNADICVNKHKQNPESTEAHNRNRGNRELHYFLILRVLAAEPAGMIEEEISAACGLLRHSRSGRLAELKKLGLVVRKTGPNGEYLRRPTSSRSPAAILVVSDLVLEALGR
jgi:hypothetical protein